MNDYTQLTPEATGLDPELLARLTRRTQHRDLDGIAIMSREELPEAVELDRIERDG